MKRSSEEIEFLVLAFQEGSHDAALQLLDYYDAYFKSLLQVLTTHHTIVDENGKKRKARSIFRIEDRQQRNFVRCFVKYQETRQNVHMYARSEFIRKVLYITVSDMRKRFALYDEHDFLSEMHAILLEMAMHHHKPGFKAYVKHFFHLKLYKKLRKWNNDPYFDKRIEFDEEDIEVDEPDVFDQIEWDKPINPYHIVSTTEESDYDENWINGYNCGDLFAGLTPYERRLIKWCYEWKTLKKEGLPKEAYAIRHQQTKFTEQDIADRLGCSRKSVNVKKREIKSRIEKQAKEMRLLC